MLDYLTEHSEDGDIHLSQPHEVWYWSKRFGVSAERLNEAVMKVGSRVDDVQRDLANDDWREFERNRDGKGPTLKS